MPCLFPFVYIRSYPIPACQPVVAVTIIADRAACQSVIAITVIAIRTGFLLFEYRLNAAQVRSQLQSLFLGGTQGVCERLSEADRSDRDAELLVFVGDIIDGDVNDGEVLLPVGEQLEHCLVPLVVLLVALVLAHLEFVVFS